jgi:hypothetical protein
MNENDWLMTVREVGNFFKVDVDAHTVYVWAYSGKIPYSKINGCVRFKRSDLNKLIEVGRRVRRGQERGNEGRQEKPRSETGRSRKEDK